MAAPGPAGSPARLLAQQSFDVGEPVQRHRRVRQTRPERIAVVPQASAPPAGGLAAPRRLPLHTAVSLTADLLRRWHEGDSAALGALLAADSAWITAHVQRRLGPLLRARADTEDIVQNTLVEVLRTGPRFVVEDREHLRALLARMVENVLRNQARHDRQQRRDVRREQPLGVERSESVLQLGVAASGPGPASQAAAGEQRDWVALALELLEPEDRLVIVWREFDGLPFAAIAERLAIDEAHARVRFQRALPKLGKKLQQLQQGHLDQALEP